jgi:acyl-CoA dehydrogenase
MNFEFSAQQLQLKEEARRVLADLSPPSAVRRVLESGSGIDRSLWTILGEVGFLGAAIPEVYGGTGAGYLELCVIAEEVGRANAALPFSSSICLGAELLLAAGSPAQKTQWLPRLARGASVACVALAEGPGAIDERGVQARFEDGRLEGSKTAVLDAGVADLAIVTARHQGHVALVLVRLNEDGVERTPQQSIDPSRSQARIGFRGARAELLSGEGWPVLRKALDRAAVLMAFEQLGGAERAMEMARDYALERYAFGRPIGSFQAIKHKLADLYVALVLARSNGYYGAWALAEDAAELPEAAAAARVSVTEAARLCVKENIQVHGGMGFTWDFDCHLYYRRAHLLALVLGGLGHWQDRLVQQLRLRRDSHCPLAHGL